MEMIKREIWKKIVALGFFFVVFGFYGMAQDIPGVYVYPEKNQSHDQQVIDKHTCFTWAKQEASTNPSGQPKESKHKTLKRTGVGAGAGAIIGGGKGAAIGAGAGAVSGKRSSKNAKREASEEASDDVKRAYASCLKSKGYSVE